MFISIFGWIIGGLLTVSSVLIIAGSYLERSHSLCTPNCTDLPFVAAFAVLGILGAAVSASISQLSKPRSTYVRRTIISCAAIYLIASIASLFFIGSSLTLVFIISAFIMMAMIAWVVSTHGSYFSDGCRNSRR